MYEICEQNIILKEVIILYVKININHVTFRGSMQTFRGRSLKWIPIDESELLTYQTKMTQITLANESQHKANVTTHHIRHHGKHHKEAVVQSNDVWKSVSHPTELLPAVALNGTTKWRQHDVVESGLNISASLNVEKTPICYTTNEVLIIIGLTCVLNFAFIVLIMSCVHFCTDTTTGKITDLPR